MKLEFPKDFTEKAHEIYRGAKQWNPTKETETFISVIGGGKGIYGDGVKTFEIMIANDTYSYESVETINQLLAKI